MLRRASEDSLPCGRGERKRWNRDTERLDAPARSQPWLASFPIDEI
jgi:hypothetical protein